ncbi:uncharacterized protein sgo2 isoform X1 [Gadus macrocephalus]|uniref:uncharacterized protein sgo2 isoform X1 n=1 Tax=Gadus macrocephalus TaxID=80720 RepID=UPI0028CB5F9E|nr:uncharacterized protein sgo2 isoform X1 [Gadus macrocephalus]XP_059896835.1 uncharacterized protein sgo2 isoform X1 [Gadus macrocephalus]XP_059896836.1 uncharacterized protein sgo2 isoform X1 [Gadus macrocephalus]
MSLGIKMTTIKFSKQTDLGVLASKIKNKMLNSSSFFKISLKTNNRALAVALQAQREKSNNLQMEIIGLLKQVDALLFERASMRYKHKQLVLMVKGLRSTTMHQLSSMADILSSEDDDCNNQHDDADGGDVENKSLLPCQPQPLTEAHHSPIKTLVDLTNTISGVQGQPSNDMKIDKEGENTSDEAGQLAQWRTTSQSSSLREDVEQYSRTQPGRDSHSMLPSCPQNSHTPAAVVASENKRLSVSVDLQKSSAQELTTTASNNNNNTTTSNNDNDHRGGQEVTLLLNTTMEMTVRDATEIIIVDTKKKSRKTNEPKIKDQAAPVVKAKKEKKRNKKPGRPEDRDSTECGLVETQHVHTAALPLSEDRTEEASGTNKVVSRIPRFGKAKACDGPNTIQKKPQSYPSIALPEYSGCDVVEPDRHVPTVREDARWSPNHVFSEDGNAKKKLRRTNVASNPPRVIKRKTPIPLMNLSNAETQRTSNGKTTEEVDTAYSDAFSGQLLESQQLPVASNDNTPFELGGGDLGFPEAGHPESKDLNLNRELRKTFVVTRDGSPWESFSPDISTGASILTPSSASRGSEGQQDASVASSPRQVSEATLHRFSGPNYCDKVDVSDQTHLPRKRPYEEVQGHEATCSNGIRAAWSEQSACPFNVRKKKVEKSRHQQSHSPQGYGPQDQELPPHQDDTQTGKVVLDGTHKKSILSLRTSRVAAGTYNEESPQHIAETVDVSPDTWVPKRLPPPSRSKKSNSKKIFSTSSGTTRKNFVAFDNKRMSDVLASDGGMDQCLTSLLLDERPPWETPDVSLRDLDMEDHYVPSPKKAVLATVPGLKEPPPNTVNAFTARRGLMSVTNTITDSGDAGGRTRRPKASVNYKEPGLTCKLRRGDSHTDTSLLMAPIYKEKKKKKQTKMANKQRPESSLSLGFLVDESQKPV